MSSHIGEHSVKAPALKRLHFNNLLTDNFLFYKIFSLNSIRNTFHLTTGVAIFIYSLEWRVDRVTENEVRS